MKAFDGGISKIIENIARVSKNDTYWEFGNKKGVISKPDKILISPTFFLSDGCNNCGRCCGNYGHILTESEYEILQEYNDNRYTQELIDYLEPTNLYINGELNVVFIDKPRKSGLNITTNKTTRPACYWLEEKEEGLCCKIYNNRTLTCRMPHLMLRFNNQSKTTTVGINQFGRNWCLGCDYQFEECTEESIKDNLNKIRYIQRIASDLKIDNYCAEIIDVVQYYVIQNGVQMPKSNLKVKTNRKELF